MTLNKRKKNSRQRGSHTHGWGAMKKHRGHGNRGGAGRAGTGKRADSKKPSIWKTKYFGKHGFTSHGNHAKTKAVNASYLDQHIKKLTGQKLAKEEKDGYSIELQNLGFNKLISKGKIKNKLFITCRKATEAAIKAVNAAGGSVTLPKKEETTNGHKGNTPKPS